jgi:hypothetical protein
VRGLYPIPPAKAGADPAETNLHCLVRVVALFMPDVPPVGTAPSHIRLRPLRIAHLLPQEEASTFSGRRVPRAHPLLPRSRNPEEDWHVPDVSGTCVHTVPFSNSTTFYGNPHCTYSVQSVRRSVALVSHVYPKDCRYLLSVATIQADVAGEGSVQAPPGPRRSGANKKQNR